jgi:hypothetical protein
MCSDFYNFFRARANAMGRALVVTDPRVTPHLLSQRQRAHPGQGRSAAGHRSGHPDRRATFWRPLMSELH